MKSTSRWGVVALGLGVLAGACGGSDGAGTSDDHLEATKPLEPLPVMHGDSAWLECDDGTLALNVFEHRAPDGASRVTAANLFVGANRVAGTIDDAGSTSLSGGNNAFHGSANVDFVKNTVALKGSLSLSGSAFPIDKQLSCTSLGPDFGKTGPAIPPPQGHGDSMWLVCDSQTLVANILEHRNATGDGRVTSITLIAGGGSLVSGDLVEDATAASLSGGASSDSFTGDASVSLTGSLSIKLKGTYKLGGTPFGVDQTIACRQLFSDL